MAETATELNDLLTFYIHSQDNGYQATELLERSPFTPHYAQSAGWALFPAGHQRPAVEVVVAAAFRVLRENDPADIAALVRVDRILDHGNVHEPYVTWEGNIPASRFPLLSRRTSWQVSALESPPASLKRCGESSRYCPLPAFPGDKPIGE